MQGNDETGNLARSGQATYIYMCIYIYIHTGRAKISAHLYLYCNHQVHRDFLITLYETLYRYLLGISEENWRNLSQHTQCLDEIRTENSRVNVCGVTTTTSRTTTLVHLYTTVTKPVDKVLEKLSFSDGQEIPYTLRNPKVHYRIHNSPPFVPILIQINPVHLLPTYFFNIPFNIIFLPTPRISQWSLSLRRPHENPVSTSPLPHTCHIPNPSNSYYLIARIIFIKGQTSWSSLCMHLNQNCKSDKCIYISYKLINKMFGGLEVACWPLVPKFAGSNPAEAVGFLRAKKSLARLPSEGK